MFQNFFLAGCNSLISYQECRIRSNCPTSKPQAVTRGVILFHAGWLHMLTPNFFISHFQLNCTCQTVEADSIKHRRKPSGTSWHHDLISLWQKFTMRNYRSMHFAEMHFAAFCLQDLKGVKHYH